ncbi:ead/Ea22-like family protein [Pseudomonas aeruginosa]|uniref:ead/Ea22-like family protein n=1 Tax=Pseudomonas aeruginosa TaxID=287 RepID=UPI00396A1F8B
MTDHAELRRLAEAATPGPWVTDAQQNGAIFNIESESGDMCIAMSQENPAPTRLEINEQRRANAEFIAAANPQAILGLLERLRLTELKGLMDAQSNMDLIKYIGRLKSQNDLMLNAIVKSRTALMVGRPTSKVAGQKYTEAFAAIVAALEGATQ